MKNLKRSVSFLDADGFRAIIDAEITDRNGYPEFTASGSYLNSCGQCLDDIKPAADSQRQLIQLWKEYHLNSKDKVLPADLDITVNTLMNVIEAEETERQKLKEQADADAEKYPDTLLLDKMSEYNIDDDMLDACRAYLELFSTDTLKNFNEAYQGTYRDDEEFAQHFAEDCGFIDESATWPNNYIDWESASRELMYDYCEQNGCYFRNI